MHVHMMKALVIFVIVRVGNCAAYPVAANDTGVQEEAFTTSRIKLGVEEIFILTAADGTHLTTIDVVRDEGYEIELTQDGRKCRLSKVQDNSSCFEEVPLAENEPVLARISDRCKGREIVTLKPKDCNAKSSLEKEATTREKRFVRFCTSNGPRAVCGFEGFLNWVCHTENVEVTYIC